MTYKIKPIHPAKYETSKKVFGLEGKRLIGHDKNEDFYEDTEGNTYSFDGKKLTKLENKRSWVLDKNFKITTLPDEKILAKEGKWYAISFTDPKTKQKQYAVSDGWKVNFATPYDKNNIGYDDPFVIPEKTRDKLSKKIVEDKFLQGDN
jgi:hypothetical protein